MAASSKIHLELQLREEEEEGHMGHTACSLTFVDLGPVEAVEYGVEHDLGVVAVGVGLGAEAVRVGDDPAVLADDRVGRRLGHVLPALRHPRAVQEVFHLAERLVVRRGGVKS